MNGSDEEVGAESPDAVLKSIRIRPELRAAQVVRARRMTPAVTLYFDEKYDLGKTDIPASFRKVTLLETLGILLRSQAEVLEVPEPLWLRFAPKNLLILSTWKLSGIFKSKPRTAVTYAIENNDLGSLIAPRIRLHPILERLFGAMAGAAMMLTLDRIAFGSSASKDLYHSLAGVGKIPYTLVEELPARNTIDDDGKGNHVNGLNAIFIGELDDRKGVIDLMSAWHSVESTIPSAVVRVIGSGAHTDVVRQWCSERPKNRIFHGFVQHDQTTLLLSKADVLVAPSRRAGRWREQIGLPIVEALALGLTIVTTDETGLAEWLRRHGHRVIPEKDVKQELAAAIEDALLSPISRGDVIRSLPLVPGRIAADSWLHTLKFPEPSEDARK